MNQQTLSVAHKLIDWFLAFLTLLYKYTRTFIVRKVLLSAHLTCFVRYHGGTRGVNCFKTAKSYFNSTFHRNIESGG